MGKNDAVFGGDIVTRFISNNIIEDRAQNLIQEYLQKTGKSFSLPVPASEIAEIVLDLNILYDSIPEKEGQTILGGLYSWERTITINEKYIDHFEETPGRELFTCAHEIGHWELHVDNKQGVPQLCFEIGGKDGRIMCRDGDRSPLELQADYFAGALIMPKPVLLDAVAGKTVDWKLLYKLRDQFGVTISALVKRVNNLKIAHITNDKKIFKSKEESKGQITLF